MVHVHNIESNQPENTARSVRDNCTLNFNDVMAGQNFGTYNKCGDLNGKGGCVPDLQIVDSGRQYSSDTQEAARLSGVIHRGSLLQELDSAKNGKHDGKISKHDLDIYLRMHPENTPQTRAVQEMREAWDNRNHPNHGAVQLLKKELANERKAHRDENGGRPGFREMPEFEPLPERVRPILRRPNEQEPESIKPQGDSKPGAGEHKAKPVEAPKDLKEAGQVRPGEGYYQVAMRMIETTGHKPTHKETMELVQAMRTANDNKDVLTVRDNLSNLLDKQLPGNQGKVRDHLRKTH